MTNVAEELGFSSASAFISVFRRHLGMTPTQLIQRKT
ncbi:MAG: AraC family transcriptional regulator [Pseudohongiellaceae bacterium]